MGFKYSWLIVAGIAPLAIAVGTAYTMTRSLSSSTELPAGNPSASIKTADSREVQSCVISMAMVNDPESPLNVRSTPTTGTGNVVGRLQNGTVLLVEKEQDGWFQITQPVQGWVTKSRTSSGCNQKVERVNFGANSQSTTVTDRFIGTGMHRYLFSADKGQTLTIVREKGPFPMVMAPTGKPLVDGPDDQRTQWTGSLPESGDYTVQLDSNFRGYPYSFVVQLK